MHNNPFNVIVSLQAGLDLLDIFDYILCFDGIEQANKVYAFLKNKINSLTLMPERGRYLSINLYEVEEYNYRELIVHPWRIFYEINDNNVDVIAIWDGRRDIKDLLKERLLKN